MNSQDEKGIFILISFYNTHIDTENLQLTQNNPYGLIHFASELTIASNTRR
jgi:hypothetical protein